MSITDPDFASNITQAKAAGVLIGAYHFARPEFELGTAGADESAAQFWNVAGSYIIADGMSLMPALDYEIDPGSAYTQATSSQWVNEWCQDIVNYGAAKEVAIKPVIYCGAAFAAVWLDDSVTGWPLWRNNFNGGDPQIGSPGDDTPGQPGAFGSITKAQFQGWKTRLTWMLSMAPRLTCSIMRWFVSGPCCRSAPKRLSSWN